jgi:hypothetical protein
MKQEYKLLPIQVDFLLFAYDLEFFTIEWMAQQLSKSYNQTKDWLTVRLRKRELLFDYFSMEDIDIHKDTSMWFRDENRWNYRKRYSLTQEGRMHCREWIAYHLRGQETVELQSTTKAVINTDHPQQSRGYTLRLF